MKLVLRFTVICVLVALAACGGRGGLQPGGTEFSPAELERLLFAELARLDKDPAKVVALAPSAGSDVFDLTGTGIDPDGPGGAAPSGVTLQWTERFPGDYDNNGLASLSDLTSLGARLGQSVQYRDPAGVGGITYWPEGDPADLGGGTTAPAPGSGAANWLAARNDGDGNGQININDLTPLAAHFGEQLDGYRIYRKAPGEANFSLVSDPGNPTSPLTIRRTDVTGGNNSRPVIYAFDDYFGADGIYEYRVVPYCIGQDSEGAASLSLFIDSATGNTISSGLQAVLQADVTSGVTPLAVDFDASLSAGNIVRFEWDFDGDGTFDRNTGNVGVTDFIFVSNATYNSTVRVTDNKGQTSSASITITAASPAGNNPPTAALSADVTQGITPLTVQFDASGSLDTDGQIVTHEWDFEGDGVFDQNTGTVATVSHMFTTPASYPAVVRVTDDQGGSATASLTIQVLTPSGNIPPLAALTADKTSGQIPLDVVFSGAGSSDADGTIVTHEWDFDGDGTYDLNTGTLASAGYTYATKGQFTARLRVTDNAGSTAIASLLVDSDPPLAGNKPPAVSLSATPTSGQVAYTVNGTPPNETYTNNGLAVDFTATANDTDGTITKYEWDFEGDGIFDFTSGTDNTVTFSYKLAEISNARVRVIDNSNGVGISQAVPITVQNRAPFAKLSFTPAASPTGVETPVTVRLSAQGSVDIDGEIVKYEWDLNGDGQFTYGTFTDPDTGQTLPTDVDSGGQNFIDRVYSAGISGRTDTLGVRLTDSSGATTYASVSVVLKDAYHEIEHNDSPAQATQFSIGSTTAPLALKGNMGGQQPNGYDGDETDWYRITLPGPRSVDLTLDGFSSSIDLNLAVYASNGSTVLASSTKPGHDNIDDLVFLSSSTFFVKVTRFSGDELVDHDYDLTITPLFLPYKETEATDSTANNDTSATAQELLSGEFAPNGHLLDFYGRFATAGNNNDNADWYKWNITGGVDLNITLNFRHLDADLDIYLVDSQGNTVAASTSNTDNESILIANNDPSWHAGLWYVKVARAAGGNCSYQLDLIGGGGQTLHTITGEANDEVGVSYQPNGTDVTWTDINTNQSVTVQVGNSGAWSIDLPDGQYEFSIPGTGSKLYWDNPRAIIEDLPCRMDIVNGEAIYKGTNAQFFDDTIPQPIKTGVQNII